jgi:hypothetical protein
MEVKIKPGLFWVRNQQAFSLQPANYALDHPIARASTRRAAIAGPVYAPIQILTEIFRKWVRLFTEMS